MLAVVFLLVEAAPGTAADAFFEDRPVPPETKAALEHAFGLDLPPGLRFVRWVVSAATGDFGVSLSKSRPVSSVLADALPETLGLMGLALAVHLAAGVGLGIVGARFRGRWPDRAGHGAALLLWSLPPFWLGLMAILLLAYAVPLFPPAGARTLGAPSGGALAGAWDFLRHAALPAATLGLSSAAVLGRHVRAGLVDALGEAFVVAARARGAGSRRALTAHALRNAMLPAIQLAGLSLPALVSGSLAIEFVFSWPGMGRLAYGAVVARDLPLVLATTLAASALVVVGSLAADLGAMAADPRLRGAERR